MDKRKHESVYNAVENPTPEIPDKKQLILTFDFSNVSIYDRRKAGIVKSSLGSGVAATTFFLLPQPKTDGTQIKAIKATNQVSLIKMVKTIKGSDYVRTLKAEEVDKVVSEYPTKYGNRGFTELEKQALLKQYGISEKKFNAVLNGNHRIIKGETVYPRRSIRMALCVVLNEVLKKIYKLRVL